MGFFWEVTSLNLSISCHGDVVCWKVKHLHVTENPELHLKSPRWLAEPALWHRSVLLAGWCSPQTVSTLVSEINFRRKTRSDWQDEKLQASNISVHLPATPLTLCRCGQEAGSPWSVTGNLNAIFWSHQLTASPRNQSTWRKPTQTRGEDVRRIFSL